MDSDNKFESCYFCKKDNVPTIKTYIARQEVSICSECVERLLLLINSENLKTSNDFSLNVKKPNEIKEYLDKFVVGQDDAKKILSVGVYNHYKRLVHYRKSNDEDDSGKYKDVVIEKSNVLLIGETGTGKTYLAKMLAKIINVPFCIVDATSLTEAGYVGDDVESILSRLLQVSNYDIRATERGIIYIDEIDKIGRKSDNPSITRDVSGEGVQQALLKILEGSKVNVSPQGNKRHSDQRHVVIDTTNILFICGGAFEGLNKIIGKRTNNETVGFNTINKHNKNINILKNVNVEDLKRFGLIPEFIGRLPIISCLDPVDKNTLKKILLEPQNSIIKQYKALFYIDNVDLDIDNEVTDYIVDKAYDMKIGARGLKSICEKIFNNLTYELSLDDNVKKFTLTMNYLKDKGIE